jgi:Tfp pilus assembly protein PilN
LAIEQAAPLATPPPPECVELRPVAPAQGLRKWFAIGSGVGIEIAGGNLRVAVAKVRPGGVEVTAHCVIENFESRPAAEWGAEYAAFAKRAQVSALPVTVLLPRSEVIVRHLNLPGVNAKELGSAVSWQVESLHPYADQPMAHAWAKLGEATQVMVALVRQEVVDHYSNLFSEAGLKLASFTFSAAALYSASRILVTPPPAFLAVREDGEVLEAYGESAARPVFSTWFDDLPSGVEPRALAEMRADADLVTGRFADLLPPLRRSPGADYEAEPMSLALAGAIVNACPRLSLDANLLPVERRSQSARWMYLPTAILGGLLTVAALLLAWQPGYQEREYLRRLDAEIRRIEPRAQQAAKLDAAVADARQRIDLLDEFRRRSQADADALRELTNLLQPPGWVQSLTISRGDLQIAGEAEQAAALIKMLDGSALFKDSVFSNSVTRNGSAEGFAIRTQREGPGTGEAH